MELLLVALRIAVLEYVAQVDVEVELVTCTDEVAPAAMLPRLHPNVWLPADPVIEQVPGPVYAGLMLQLTPVPAGRGSLIETAVAALVPAAALLLACTVKPMEAPAVTLAASAVLVMLRFGHCTVVEALD
jgi:hypothetical protein